MPCISAMLTLADALYIIFVFLYWTRNKGDKYRFGVAKKMVTLQLIETGVKITNEVFEITILFQAKS